MRASRDKIVATALLACLLLIVWAMFIGILYMLAIVVIPLLGPGFDPLPVAAARIGIAFLTLAAWVYVWHKLAEVWLYRLLMRRSGRDGR